MIDLSFLDPCTKPEQLFGREHEVDELIEGIIDNPLFVLYGPVGSGKTSLIQAGAIPRLEEEGHTCKPYRLYADSVVATLRNVLDAYPAISKVEAAPDGNTTDDGKSLTIIFLDHFEEFFVYYHEHPELPGPDTSNGAEDSSDGCFDEAMRLFRDLGTWFAALDARRVPGVRVVLSLRERWYAQLGIWRAEAPSLLDGANSLWWRHPTVEQARRILDGRLGAGGGQAAIAVELADLALANSTTRYGRVEVSRFLMHAAWLSQRQSSDEGLPAGSVLPDPRGGLRGLAKALWEGVGDTQRDVVAKVLPEFVGRWETPRRLTVGDLEISLGMDQSDVLKGVRILQERRLIHADDEASVDGFCLFGPRASVLTGLLHLLLDTLSCRLDDICQSPAVLDPVTLKQIALMISRGRVAFFLGSGASIYDRLPSLVWKGPTLGLLPSAQELSDYFCETYSYECRPAELAKVSSFVEISLGNAELYDALHRVFAAAVDPRPLHHLIARLPRSEADVSSEAKTLLLMTTNYDDLIEKSLEAREIPHDVLVYQAVGKHQGHYIHYPYKGEPTPIVDPNTYAGVDPTQRSLVIKVHGSLNLWEDAGNDSYVITEDDYLNYLMGVTSGSLGLPPMVLSEIRERHLLFMGYSLRDWTMQIFLARLLKEIPLTRIGWAVQREHDVLETLKWSNRKVKIIRSELDDFLDALGRRLEN